MSNSPEVNEHRPEDFAVPTPDDLATYAEPGVKVFFNPFRFSIEQNNEFLAKGYEVMPLRIPK